MAKILFTAFMADARGKVAGTVFSKNKAGAYTRTKVTPANARTVAQMDARNLFGSFSANWRGLTQTQRNAWNEAAKNFPRNDVFGNVRYPSGMQLYIGLNSNLSYVGAQTIEEAPTPGELPIWSADIYEAQIISSSAGTDWESLTITTGTALPAGYRLMVFGAPAMSAGRETVTRWKLLSPFVEIEPGEDTSDMRYSVTPFYNSALGVPAQGAKIGIRCVLVNTATGEASAPIDLVFIPTYTIE